MSKLIHMRKKFYASRKTWKHYSGLMTDDTLFQNKDIVYIEKAI
jgi:hypothetical protein